jgi:hypothetical protein
MAEFNFWFNGKSHSYSILDDVEQANIQITKDNKVVNISKTATIKKKS